jgi:hypothetical protein
MLRDSLWILWMLPYLALISLFVPADGIPPSFRDPDVPSTGNRLEVSGILSAKGEVLLSRNAPRNSELDRELKPRPSGIVEYDLWAIRDLLKVGKRGALLFTDDNETVQNHPGVPKVHAAVDALANMLHEIHPVPACRAAIQQATTTDAKADAAWSCLGLTEANFTGAFTDKNQKAVKASRTEPKFKQLLGACKDSLWPRACSYWTSMHTMAVRAEHAQKGDKFVEAVFPIMAGGALFCYACTSHFVLLNQYLLPIELRNASKLWSF